MAARLPATTLRTCIAWSPERRAAASSPGDAPGVDGGRRLGPPEAASGSRCRAQNETATERGRRLIAAHDSNNLRAVQKLLRHRVRLTGPGQQARGGIDVHGPTIS